MIVKPSFTIGIKESGEIDILKIGSAEDCKETLLDETKNPSGKYVQLQYYRKPPYSKRRDIKTQAAEATPKKKRGRKSED
tara:strand:- start:20811 stop:21050 length:240 start_codon:yes stop_codon:yes gene_type:complete